MNLLDKVKEIFKNEKFEDVNLTVKTKDGDIFMVKGTELKVDSEIVKIDTDAKEVAIADGDYVLEDESTLTIKDGKITVITPEAETPAEDKAEGGKEEMKVVNFAVIKQISKWSLDVDQDSITVGTILTQTWVNADGTSSDPCPVMSGEYELENGDLIQVDSDGKVVLVTKGPEKPVEDTPVVEEPVVAESEEMKAIKLELEAIKETIKNKDTEFAKVSAELEAAKKAPAAKAIDTKKFEKTENISETKKDKTMLSIVDNILNKK